MQSGRYVNISNTFLQESIESESLILVVYWKEGQEAVGKLEERELELIESYRRLVKKSSLSF